MDLDRLNKHSVMKGFLIFLYAVLAINSVDSQDSKQRICSIECTKWAQKECLNGNLKSEERKMVSEEQEIGPNCTKVEKSGKIQEMQNTIQNLVTRLEITTRENEELKRRCNKVIHNNCSEDEFKCESTDYCIPLNYKCNGKADCADGSDESVKNCNISTESKYATSADQDHCSLFMRLSNSIHNNYGILEIYLERAWMAVCDDSFTNIDAIVACRQLNFNDGRLQKGSALGINEAPLKAVKFQCSGTESSLNKCNMAVSSICLSNNYVTLFCSRTFIIEKDFPEIRIKDGQSSGLLEANQYGFWGPICDAGWTNMEAHAACRQLGKAGGYAYYAITDSDNPMVVGRLNCSDDVDALNECDFKGFGEYLGCHYPITRGSRRAAGVFCYDHQDDLQFRLYDRWYGRVQVKHNGEWGRVCNTNWGNKEASTLCKQLDYIDGRAENIPSKSNEMIRMDNVNCSGTESSILECNHRSSWTDSLGPCNDARAICNTTIPLKPRNLRATARGPNKIKITWDAPEDFKQIMKYTLYYNDSRKHTHGQVKILPPATKYILTELVPDTIYHIQLAAWSVSGLGARTILVQAKTPEIIPNKPKRVLVLAVNSTTIYVDWQPPKDHNGMIRGYYIYYNQVVDYEPIPGNEKVLDVDDENKKEAVITGLLPDTRYQVTVAGYTRRGVGIKSRPQIIRTMGPVPSAPRKLRAQHVWNATAKISWWKPEFPNGVIKGYKLYWGHKGHVYEHIILKETVHAWYSPPLDRGALYQFRVYSRNEIDYGERAVTELVIPD